ncbi:hypothetical protein [Schleiferilactobacillus perolens]|jgi:hypothetical protein|uniref:hypothetical protein n=1 Tax=Schleiferilactobacillus perolens TaxID=100468 RepID=UPI0023552D88|nr:hypothetical protein [Schleiferilactobacillus perolens]MCI2171060.1 hypothetical protein [Schleiferilactobacillus perolens]
MNVLKEKGKILSVIFALVLAFGIIAPSVSYTFATDGFSTEPVSSNQSNTDPLAGSENWTPEQIAEFLKNNNTQPTTTQTSSALEAKAEPYITVKNNQYVILDGAKSVLTTSEYSIVSNVVKKSNTDIIAGNLLINPENKVAAPLLTLRSFQEIEYTSGWNYQRLIFRSDRAINTAISFFKFISHGYSVEAAYAAAIVTIGGTYGAPYQVLLIATAAFAETFILAQVTASMAGTLQWAQDHWPNNYIAFDVNKITHMWQAYKL